MVRMLRIIGKMSGNCWGIS